MRKKVEDEGNCKSMIDSSGSDDGQWSKGRKKGENKKEDDDEGLMKLFSGRLSTRDWAVSAHWNGFSLQKQSRWLPLKMVVLLKILSANWKKENSKKVNGKKEISNVNDSSLNDGAVSNGEGN